MMPPGGQGLEKPQGEGGPGLRSQARRAVGRGLLLFVARARPGHSRSPVSPLLAWTSPGGGGVD